MERLRAILRWSAVVAGICLACSFALGATYGGNPSLGGGGGGGGSSTINTAAPLSGDGSIGSPATIANGVIALSKLATEADQTIVCNVAGSTVSPTACSMTAIRGALAAFVPVDGTTFGDTSPTLAPGTDQASRYVQTGASLTANRTVVLSVTSALQGQVACIVRKGAGAFPLNMNGASSTNLCNGSTGLSAPTGTKYPQCCAQFNGTDWQAASVGFVTQ